MEALKNKFITIKSRIEDEPQEFMFEIKTQTILGLLEPESNDVIVKCLYISIDPAQINRMKKQSSSQTSVAQASEITPGMWNIPLTVTGKCNGETWVVTEYTIVKGGNMLWKLEAMEFPLSYHISVIGTSGLIAYGGFFQICRPKKGEKVFVSAAAGSVANLVGQYAKLFGCYVVGCAGTKEKGDLLKGKLKFDDAFNYKEETDLISTLRRYFPNGIDIYFDNVGGDMLEAVVANMNTYGRVAVYGAISDYTNLGKRATLNMIDVIYKRIIIKGFLSTDFSLNEIKDFMSTTTNYVCVGKLCVLENISYGIEIIPYAFIGLFQWRNVGKKIVQIAEE